MIMYLFVTTFLYCSNAGGFRAEDAAITMLVMVMSCGSETYRPAQPEPILSPAETVGEKKKLKCESILQLMQ